MRISLFIQYRCEFDPENFRLNYFSLINRLQQFNSIKQLISLNVQPLFFSNRAIMLLYLSNIILSDGQVKLHRYYCIFTCKDASTLHGLFNCQAVSCPCQTQHFLQCHCSLLYNFLDFDTYRCVILCRTHVGMFTPMPMQLRCQ